MSDNVAMAEAQLELARRSAEYDAVQERVQSGAASDEDRAQYRALGAMVAAARTEVRRMRDAVLVAEGLAPGEAVATPEAVAGTSGVNEEEA